MCGGGLARLPAHSNRETRIIECFRDEAAIISGGVRQGKATRRQSRPVLRRINVAAVKLG